MNARLRVQRFDRLLSRLHILGRRWAIVGTNACDIAQV